MIKVRCPYCKAEWNAPGEKVTPPKCPFCGKELVVKNDCARDTLDGVLLEIANSFGVDTLKDNRRTLALFCDLAPQLKKERILLAHFFDATRQNVEAIFCARFQTETEQKALSVKIYNKLVDEWAIQKDAAATICKGYFRAIGISTQNDVIGHFATGKLPSLSAEECHKKGDNCYDAKDYVRAAEWYQKATDENYAPSQVKLAIMFLNGEGVERDVSRAFTLFKQAADLKNARAMFYVGRCYSNGDGVMRNINVAIQWYMQAVKLNDECAMVNLGACYEHGLGVPKDLTEAFNYYKMAADLDEPLGQYNLGLCYECGRGVDKNYNNAFRWYSLSAEQGEPAGQAGLGRCYFWGHGTEQDYKQAFFWLKRAAEQDEPLALKLLADCYAEGKGVNKDECEALALFDRAFSKGISSSLVGVLKIYSQRKCLSEQDCNNLLKYFPKDDYSDREVSVIKKCGLFFALNMINYDSTKLVGMKWIQICADTGNARAQFLLGEAYRNSNLNDKARFWLQKAADQGHEKAKVVLNELTVFPSRTIKLTESIVSSLVRDYRLESIYFVRGTSIFEKKIRKAMKAYAHFAKSEIPLLIYDNTLFGSAKEGFVLTDKAVYLGGDISGETNSYLLSQIVKVDFSVASDNSRFYVDLYIGSAAKSNLLHLSHDSEENSIRYQCKFWNKLLGFT